MDQIYQIISMLKRTDSSTDKQKILAEHKDNETLRKVFFYAYNKRITFGVSDVEPTDGPASTTFDDFFQLLEKLHARELTGNAARDAVNSTVGMMKVGQGSIAHKVIKRDLDCGVGVGTINKTWPDLIPKQPQMLAQPAKKKNIDKILFPAYAQLKADGARCFVNVIDGHVSFVSRSGKEYLGLDALAEQFLKMHEILYRPIDKNMVYDGELVVHDKDGVTDRQKSNGIANKALSGTISNEEQLNMKIEIWDAVPHEQYYEGVYSVPYCDRFEILSRSIERAQKGDTAQNVILIENNIVNSIDEAVAVYEKYIEQGYEGIILKNISAPWEDKRSVHQVKFKQIIDVDMEIADVYPHNKDPSKAGGFWVRSRCGTIYCKAGSGLSDTTRVRDKVTKKWVDIPLSERDELDRELVMTHKDRYIGQIVHLECNGATERKGRREDEAQYKLFLPIIKELRKDKDEANSFDEVDWTGTSWLR